VCGTKNFSSVRLYSAPQLLHRTIVTIPGICAFGEQDQDGSFRCKNELDTKRELQKRNPGMVSQRARKPRRRT